jgi:formate dehydrogenase alpha subunit
MITLNGRQIETSGSILDACRDNGIDLPAFCSPRHVTPGGHCRACLVEVDGRILPACTTRARSGQRVETDTERLRAYRRDLGELMLSASTPDGDVKKTLQGWGATGARYGRATGGERRDSTHRYLRIGLDKCILCRACVRACEEIQGEFVYAVQGRGNHAELGWGPGSFAESACVSCGACTAVCPSGAISDVDRDLATERKPERVVQTTCAYCGTGCQLQVHATGTDIVRIEGAESPVNAGHLCVKGRYAHSFVTSPERLRTALVRKGGVLVPVPVDEAIRTTAEHILRLRGRVAALSSARCTNEENYLVQKWFRGGLGTNDVDCCARVCHAPSAAGLRRSFGTGAASNSLRDIDSADAILVVGSNPTEAHPVTGVRIRRAVLAGAHLVVVDPRRTALAEIADVHLRPRPGTNVPLFNSLAAVLVEEELIDTRFIQERSEGWEEYRDFIRKFSPERTESLTGVPATLVRRASRIWGTAERPLEVHGLGVTEHVQGSESVMLLANLAILTGAIGRPGVGINPLRGQNNVQGAADMGCQPDLLTGYQDPTDSAVRSRFEEVWKRPLPSEPGRTLPRMWDAALAGEIRGMYILGEDVATTDPDSKRVVEALGSLELLVVQELFLSDTARLAHVVLPGASAFEKDGTFTNGERRIQRVRRVVEPPGEARADWQILCDLMAASGYPQSFARPGEILDEIARVAPIYAGVAQERLDPDGLQWPVPSEDHPGTPILHVDRFARGRALLSCVDWAPSPTLTGSDHELVLITGRVLEHYNAGSMTRRTGNVELCPRDELEIHPDDASPRGIADGDEVLIRSERGSAHAKARVTTRVLPRAPFLSFHFPETGTNALTSDVLDRIADCPEYKLTRVEIERAER